MSPLSPPPLRFPHPTHRNDPSNLPNLYTLHRITKNVRDNIRLTYQSLPYLSPLSFPSLSPPSLDASILFSSDCHILKSHSPHLLSGLFFKNIAQYEGRVRLCVADRDTRYSKALSTARRIHGVGTDFLKVFDGGSRGCFIGRGVEGLGCVSLGRGMGG